MAWREKRVYTPNVDTADESDIQARVAEIPNRCLNANLRRASRVVTQLYDRHLQPAGLRSTQFPILVNLALLGTLPMTALAERLVMDRTTLTRNLQPLREKGLVAVVAGKDARTRGVALTEQGRAKLAEALPHWEQAQAQVDASLGQVASRDLVAHLKETTARFRAP